MSTIERRSIAILTEPPPSDPDVRIAYGAEPLQFGDLRLPSGSGPHPVVIVVHGGGWMAIYNLTHAGHLCVDLASHGIATWNVEYRRIGDPGGGWPGTFDDVLKATNFLSELARDYPIDLDRVAICGHSAGGHLALLAALRTSIRLRGAVSLAGNLDLDALYAQPDHEHLVRRFMGGAPDEMRELWDDASPRVQLPLRFRYVIACGTEDVHWSSNRDTADAAVAAGDDVDFLALPGAGHFEPIDPCAAEWALIRAKLEGLVD